MAVPANAQAIAANKNPRPRSIILSLPASLKTARILRTRPSKCHTTQAMIALIQRVTRADVHISGACVGEIGQGVLALIGVTRADTTADAARLLERLLGYRADIENVYRAVDFTVLASRYEPFGLVGVESVLCGTPVLLANGIGCAEVIRAPAQLSFSLDATAGDGPGFAAAVDTALAMRRADRHRLDDPRSSLSYDPGVEPHVSALLALARALALTPGETPPS